MAKRTSLQACAGAASTKDAPPTPPTTDLPRLWRNLKADLQASLVNKDEPAHLLVVAALAGQHCLLLGPPGSAKSALIVGFVARVSGARSFSRLMTRFSTPDEVFGPVKLSALEQDRYERAVDGYLPTAHVGYLDEVMKANSAILNSLLTIINERTHDNRPVPLITLACASNELPQGDDLGALYDRLLVRAWVDYCEDDADEAALLSFRPRPVQATVTLEQWEQARAAADAVAIPQNVLDAQREVFRELRQQGVRVSDRRKVQVQSLVRAEAFLAGRDVATVDDILVLAHALWHEPAQRAKVAQVVCSKVAPGLGRLLELEDAAREQLELVRKDVKAHGTEATTKVRTSLEEAATLAPAGTADERLAGARRRLEKVQEEIGRLVLGLGTRR